MSRFMRGKEPRSDEQSNMELALMVKFQKAYLEKEIPEVPLTPPWTDILLTLDRKNPVVTRPDFRFIQSAFWKPIYIDGPHHRRRVFEKRDEEINRLLGEQGFHPLRISYEHDSKTEVRRVYETIIKEIFGEG